MRAVCLAVCLAAVATQMRTDAASLSVSAHKKAAGVLGGQVTVLHEEPTAKSIELLEATETPSFLPCVVPDGTTANVHKEVPEKFVRPDYASPPAGEDLCNPGHKLAHQESCAIKCDETRGSQALAGTVQPSCFNGTFYPNTFQCWTPLGSLSGSANDLKALGPSVGDMAMGIFIDPIVAGATAGGEMGFGTSKGQNFKGTAISGGANTLSCNTNGYPPCDELAKENMKSESDDTNFEGPFLAVYKWTDEQTERIKNIGHGVAGSFGAGAGSSEGAAQGPKNAAKGMAGNTAGGGMSVAEAALGPVTAKGKEGASAANSGGGGGGGGSKPDSGELMGKGTATMEGGVDAVGSQQQSSEAEAGDSAEADQAAAQASSQGAGDAIDEERGAGQTAPPSNPGGGIFNTNGNE